MKKIYTIAITGAGGFVGANLVEQFVARGHDVHVLVKPKKVYWRLASFAKHIKTHAVRLDDVKKLNHVFQKIKPDIIIHAAANGSYPSQDDINEKINANIIGTNNVLQSLIDIDYTCLIVIGSSSEYGKKEKPMKETDVCEPNNFYAATKLAATHLTQVYAIEHHKPAVVFRLFNVYGKYEEDGRLVRNMIEAGLSDKPMKLATGQEARDFIFVQDIADACLSLARRKPMFGEVFNIGTGKQTSIHDLAVIVKRLTKSKSEIIIHAYKGRIWDSTHWKADMTKTKRMIQWQPSHTLREGLIKTISWYKKQQNVQ